MASLTAYKPDLYLPKSMLNSKNITIFWPYALDNENYFCQAFDID